MSNLVDYQQILDAVKLEQERKYAAIGWHVVHIDSQADEYEVVRDQLVAEAKSYKLAVEILRQHDPRQAEVADSDSDDIVWAEDQGDDPVPAAAPGPEEATERVSLEEAWKQAPEGAEAPARKVTVVMPSDRVVREWAWAQGMEIAERGRLTEATRDLYAAAHGITREVPA